MEGKTGENESLCETSGDMATEVENKIFPDKCILTNMLETYEGLNARGRNQNRAFKTESKEDLQGRELAKETRNLHTTPWCVVNLDSSCRRQNLGSGGKIFVKR